MAKRKLLWAVLVYIDGEIQVLGIFSDRTRASRLARETNSIIKKLGKEEDENAFVEATNLVDTPVRVRIRHDYDPLYGAEGLHWWETY